MRAAENPELRLLSWLARRHRGVLRVWPLWENLARRIWPTMPVPGAPHAIFEIHLRRYRGTPFTLPDGTPIRPGELLAEIHLNNELTPQAVERSRWGMAQWVMADLRALAAWIASPDFPGDVKAVYGVTLLGRATAVMGFSIRERPVTLYARLDRFYMTGLLALYDPLGFERLTRGRVFGTYPHDIWLSRAQLRARYGDTEGRHGHDTAR